MDSDKIIPISSCPWCKEVPRLNIFDGRSNFWTVDIRCISEDCINPKTSEFSIRKSQRYKPDWIEKKVMMAVHKWNYNNPLSAKEGYKINFFKLAELGIDEYNKLGIR